jgi:TRAP-type uncharacterized transport system fused permease subunit
MIRFRIERTKKRKTEFSKKLLYVIFTVTGIIIAFTLYMVWVTQDLSPLTYLIPAVFAEVATATGFYYWKARKENEIKLQKIYGEDLVREEDEVI